MALLMVKNINKHKLDKYKTWANKANEWMDYS